jgi:transcription antitermination factor NusG
VEVVKLVFLHFAADGDSEADDDHAYTHTCAIEDQNELPAHWWRSTGIHLRIKGMTDTPWYVLHVISNHEKQVARHLEVRSVEHFLPLYKERAKWTDRTVITERSLFPSYLFARFPLQARRAVISVSGVLRLLGSEERDMVSSAELDKIRNGLASGLRLRPHSLVTAGTKVRLRNGIFAGVEGVVTELRNSCRIVITLAAVRQCYSLEVQAGEFDVLDKPIATVRMDGTGYFSSI